jgi:hypothetical protein
MPLDTLTFDNPLMGIRLIQTARAIGLSPIPEKTLNKHRAEQIIKHPPGFFYRNQAAFGLTSLALFLLSLFFIGLGVWSFPVLLLPGFGCLLGLVCLLTVAESKGPAHWHEGVVALEDMEEIGVPRPIADAARIMGSAVQVDFIKGTLIQEKVVLDPYLYAQDAQFNRVILGIWDGDTVIACA